ncbi:hypothetical protein [Scopulibacillus cellulosilyticus]|uniref:Asp/Glu/hydantoin racemase n=1 Tax=Scopulibacillus cellulosilyticus TaxID=2665665 RepID=A0ABW2PVG3_9BACL
MKRIGCFHAHYSNIEYIEKAIEPYKFELIHFVDPGLDCMKMDSAFTETFIHRKIKSTLDWISQCHVDAILVTCTLFTAHIPDKLSYPIPIIKIDEPLFQFICENQNPQLMVFTNPSTIKGTIDQLNRYAEKQTKTIQVKPVLLENTFELIMKGKKEEYIKQVSIKLGELIKENPNKAVSAAQLSMVPAAEKVELETSTYIGNQLKFLSEYIKSFLDNLK